MKTLPAETLELAEAVWRYMQLGHTPRAADLMLVFGTNDERVASHAASLYHQGLAPRVITTGGIAHQGDLLATPWPRPEAEVFAEEMMRLGVPREAIMLEPAASNTKENVLLAKALVADGAPVRSVLCVVKPFMQRRVSATMAVHWPEMPFSLATWETTFADYCREPDLGAEKTLNILLGDLQRLWVYGERGWAAPHPATPEVREAFDRLVASGFNRHLLH